MITNLDISNFIQTSSDLSTKYTIKIFNIPIDKDKIDNMLTSTLFLCAIIGFSSMNGVTGFTFLEEPLVEPNHKPHIGGTLMLTCVSSSPHEHCIWTHNKDVCKFDWGTRHINVQNKHCKAYGKRLEFHGVYDAQQCKIKLSDITISDSGKWTCEMVNKKNLKISEDINIEVIPRPDHPQKRGAKEKEVSSKNVEVPKGKTSNVTSKTTTSLDFTKSTTQASVSNSSLETNKKDGSNNLTNVAGDMKLRLLQDTLQ